MRQKKETDKSAERQKQKKNRNKEIKEDIKKWL